ncbi:MAG: divergent polysaccharide deacetylase family protein [Deltaproteobacteria bacterium]|nr:MAG: divergent polysaccharide deacetylase family protein [Deltaproteobacteria bacterium]
MPAKRPRSKKTEKPSSSKKSAAPKRPGKGKAARPAWGLWLALLLGLLLLGALLWLARREEQHPLRPAAPPVQTEVKPAGSGPGQAALAREQVESFLAATAVPADAISREPADAPRHYQVRHRSPSAKAVEELRRRLSRLAPPLVLSTPEDGVLAIADSQGRALLTVQYLPVMPPPKAVRPPAVRGGRVAIVVDDLGRGLKQAKQLLELRQPVTFAILAIEPHAAEVARMAHAAGREVMLHVPMEPQGFPVVDPGDDALLVSHSDAELRGRLQALLEQVPHATGINNHMGSRFTEDERAMATVMAELKERGLFFVDSLTSGHSAGAAAARQAGVPFVRRDVFLDNVAEVEPIVREIRRLVDKAGRNGQAVGICHPYPETIRALQQELPKLAAAGVEFVTVAELLGGDRTAR